jgi:hypothetical protein
MFKNCCGDCGECWYVGNPKTCTCPDEPTKREWVGLSNHDIDELIPRTDLSGDYSYQDMYAVARIVEYRLRMQNHG